MADRVLQEWLTEREQKRQEREELLNRINMIKADIAGLPKGEKSRRQKLRRRLHCLQRLVEPLHPRPARDVKHRSGVECYLPSESAFGILPNSKRVKV